MTRPFRSWVRPPRTRPAPGKQPDEKSNDELLNEIGEAVVDPLIDSLDGQCRRTIDTFTIALGDVNPKLQSLHRLSLAAQIGKQLIQLGSNFLGNALLLEAAPSIGAANDCLKAFQALAAARNAELANDPAAAERMRQMIEDLPEEPPKQRE